MPTPPLDASARLLYEEALKRGISCTTFGDHQTILMQKGTNSWYTCGSRTSFQSSVGRTISNNKYLTKKILEYYHLPTANSVTVFSEDEIDRIASLKFPVVMKPISGAHGKDVIVGIKNLEEAKKYWLHYQARMIVEEMLEGTEYRILCVDYQFVAATYRKYAYVVGDGQSTIEELVKIKNQHPWRKAGHEGNLTKIDLDEVVKNNLAELSLSSTSIPKKGEEIKLRKTANLSTGGEPWDVSKEVCPENRLLFEKIAKSCDLNTIGIDIMCQSLKTPILEQKKAGVLEVNGSPGLRMHHFPLQGVAIDAAGKILDMVEKYQKID